MNHQSSQTTEDRFRCIWRVVATIPAGHVMSYGAVARRAGLVRASRLVSKALRAAPDELELPWHRVVRADGRIAFPAGSRLHRLQIRRLTAEGVRVEKGRVVPASRPDDPDLDKLLWGPRS